MLAMVLGKIQRWIISATKIVGYGELMPTLDHPVVSSLLPVVLLILVGLVTGKLQLIRQEAVRDLSNLVFLVLTQALLFLTMSTVHIEQLDFRPVSLYFVVAAGLFTALLLVQGPSSRAAVPLGASFLKRWCISTTSAS